MGIPFNEHFTFYICLDNITSICICICLCICLCICMCHWPGLTQLTLYNWCPRPLEGCWLVGTGKQEEKTFPIAAFVSRQPSMKPTKHNKQPKPIQQHKYMSYTNRILEGITAFVWRPQRPKVNKKT